jgi:hypothetical protein
MKTLKNKIQFRPLTIDDQQLAKAYAKQLGYRSILDNNQRKNIIIDSNDKVFLLIKRSNILFCVRKDLHIPITENDISEIEKFKNKFKNINIHPNIIRFIFGVLAFTKGDVL